MKRLSLFFAILPSFCFAEFNYEQPNLNSDLIILEALKCTRKIVDERLDGLNGLQSAANILGDIHANKDNSEKLSEVLTACNNLVKKSVSIELSAQQIEDFYNGLTNEPSIVLNNLSQLIKPKVSCNYVGLSGSMGIYKAGSLGVKVGVCSGTNGHRWVLLQASIGGGEGIFFDATVSYDQFSTYIINEPSPLYITKNSRKSEAAILAYSKDAYGNTGYGFGFFGSTTSEKEYNYKAYKLEDSDSALLNLVRGSSDNIN